MKPVFFDIARNYLSFPTFEKEEDAEDSDEFEDAEGSEDEDEDEFADAEEEGGILESVAGWFGLGR